MDAATDAFDGMVERAHGTRPRRGFACGIATLVLALAASSSADPALARRAGGFTQVAVHPQAAAQPTAMGRTIATLKAWNGKLYSGYGDYDANTGPIEITPFSGGSFAASELSDDTEAVWIYRQINGRLYAPSIDPRVSADFAVGIGTTSSAEWADRTVFRSSHAFDMASLTGADLWVVGSQGNDAVAWRSLDGGSTWAEALRVPPLNLSGGSFARFYGVGTLAGKLYVQAVDSLSGLYPHSVVFDGSNWTEGPSMGWAFNHAEQFAGRLLFDAAYHSAHFVGSLMAFDGARSTLLQSSIYDYVVEGGTVYVLGSDRRIRSSTDLSSWTQLGRAPAVARSIGVLNGVVYLGGTDSAIYRQK